MGSWVSAARRAWRWGTRGHRGPLIAALCIVALAQAPYLVGALDPNPLHAVSGLNQPGGHQILPGQTSLDGNAGITSQANGHRAAIDWIHGRVPWWNPYEGTGNVLAAASVSGAMFVPFVLLTLWSDGQLPLYLCLDLVAAAATYLLLRRLGARPWACFTGAVLFGLNGTNAWLRFGADNPVAFLPVTLLGVERLRASVLARGRRGWGLIAVGVAGSLLAGFPETAYLDGVIVVGWVVVRAAVMRRGGLTVLVRSVLGAITGLLIAAPFLVALADDLPIADVGSHAGAALGSASVVREGVLSLFSPYALGPLFGFPPKHAGAAAQFSAMWGNLGGYLTAAVLVLAVIGLLGRPHRPLRVLLAALALLLLGRVFGVAPAATVVNLLPGARSMAVYRYADPAIEMAVVVLAALGVDDILRRRSWRFAGLAAAALVAVGLAFAAERAASLETALGGAHVAGWWQASLGWAGATLVVVALASIFRHRAGAAVIIAVLAVEAVAMFAVPELSAPRHVRVDTAAVAYLRRVVGTSRFVSFGVFAPNYGAYYGVASVNINDLPVPASTARVELQQLAPDADPTGFDGITQGGPGPSPRQELPSHLDGYRRLAVAYLVLPHGEGVADLPAGSVVPVYGDPLLDIYRIVGAEPLVTASGACRVAAPTITTAVVDCPAPSTVLRRETMVPGWTVSVGDRTVVPTATPSGLQLVDVPAGRTVLHYRFTPPHEGLGWAACVLGFLLLVVGVAPARLVGRWRRAAPARPRSGSHGRRRAGDPDALEGGEHGHRPDP